MPASKEQPSSLDYPELVVGIAAPIGVDMEQITQSLMAAFHALNYDSSLIKLTSEIVRYPITDQESLDEIANWSGPDTHNVYMRKMSEANALRKQYSDPAVLARIAVDSIRADRKTKTGGLDKVRARHAYIIRQLKRPEEVALLRKVYGRQFILASAYAPEQERKEQLCQRLRGELSTSLTPAKIGFLAEELIERDAAEDQEALGQQLSETFHLADVFIDGLNKAKMDDKLERFTAALFGRNDIAPSKDEYGMYAAKSAALRSSDLSRQVGAALFTDDGELVTQGCNEVPKAHGGTYWDLESPDHRDIKKGHDPNDRHKKEIVRDLVERLRKKNFLSEDITKIGNDSQIVDHLINKQDPPLQHGALVGSRIMDLTEYGRVVHAEMLAICDAARLGRSVKGATLYCTTFPCHNCTKHILASGVKRVVYMEPYPKSRAKDLHPDEIEIEAESPDKVSFVPFMGISPFRYRDLFQKGKRKKPDGKARDWYQNDEMRPMVDMVVPSYTENEKWALADMLGDVKPVDKLPATSAQVVDPVATVKTT
jgi:deoxycytidylate deaminase